MQNKNLIFHNKDGYFRPVLFSRLSNVGVCRYMSVVSLTSEWMDRTSQPMDRTSQLDGQDLPIGLTGPLNGWTGPFFRGFLVLLMGRQVRVQRDRPGFLE